MNCFRYKDYIGSIDADLEAQLLHGKLLHISDLITYEAKTIPQLEQAFRKSVDDYYVTCKQLDRPPLKPFKGSINVRLGQTLHKEAAFEASMRDISINELIKQALQHEMKPQHRASQ